MSKLLINEYPLQVLPSLAKAIGLNEAIFLQQLHYWIGRSGKSHADDDGTPRQWVYNTLEEWQEQFPFWSTRTIHRTIKSLEKRGLVVSGSFNKLSIDRTKWYSIDYDALARLEVAPSPSGQDDNPDLDNLSKWNGQSGKMPSGQVVQKTFRQNGQVKPENETTLPETTSDTTADVAASLKECFRKINSTLEIPLGPKQLNPLLIAAAKARMTPANVMAVWEDSQAADVPIAAFQDCIKNNDGLPYGFSSAKPARKRVTPADPFGGKGDPLAGMTPAQAREHIAQLTRSA